VIPAGDGNRDRRLLGAVVLAAAVASLVAAWSSLGAGFQSDDFRWLWHARFDGPGDLARIFRETLGFYRPFTALLWAFDLAVAGPRPLAFSLTNLGLHVLVLGLFAGVAARLSGDRRVAAAAVALAALSYHYNVNAIVWISGRGALLATAAALACLWLWDRWCRGEAGIGAYAGACASLAVALGSYEAVAGLPLLMLLMVRWRGARLLAGAAGPLALAAVYMVARLAVGARQPWAPGQGYGYELAAMAPNLLEYAGRVATAGAIVVVLLLIAAVPVGAATRVARSAFDGGRGVAHIGGAWFLLGIAPALPVPSRSSLYVYFAALGAHLVMGAAAVAGATALWRAQRIAAGAVAGLLALIALVAWPLFAWDRNLRLVRQGRLASAAIDDMRRLVAEPAPGECLVLIDDPETQPNLHAAFGNDLRWLGAHVYGETPSDRIVYGTGQEAGAPDQVPPAVGEDPAARGQASQLVTPALERCARRRFLRFVPDPASAREGSLQPESGAGSFGERTPIR
jgi:hypothetical protein